MQRDNSYYTDAYEGMVLPLCVEGASDVARPCYGGKYVRVRAHRLGSLV